MLSRAKSESKNDKQFVALLRASHSIFLGQHFPTRFHPHGLLTKSSDYAELARQAALRSRRRAQAAIGDTQMVQRKLKESPLAVAPREARQSLGLCS